LGEITIRQAQVDVARFYKQISKTGLSSAAASKWKDRLEKDRPKLFTFLSHDGVPWNNNNAEHAIKAFARLRRAIEGLSTPKGIEEHLILLSVCQTCKYSGLDFLDFLRSGETDVATFAQADGLTGTRVRTNSNWAGASSTAKWSDRNDTKG
jgi:transposase IS66 family protein